MTKQDKGKKLAGEVPEMVSTLQEMNVISAEQKVYPSPDFPPDTFHGQCVLIDKLYSLIFQVMHPAQFADIGANKRYQLSEFPKKLRDWYEGAEHFQSLLETKAV